MRNVTFITLLLSILFVYACGNAEQDKTKTELTTTEASIMVQGNCEMCKKRIEQAASSIEGVQSASWDKDTKMLKLTYTGNVEIAKVEKALADAGHDTENAKAGEAYENLPGCCHYRENNAEVEDDKMDKDSI